MAGFTSPSILMLNTWDTAERNYCHSLLRRLPEAGYTVYEEPAVGSFAMPLVARDVGWEPSSMVASDVHLYSAVLGRAIAHADLAELNVQLNGVPVVSSTDPFMQAAEIVWAQYIARVTSKASTYYWSELIQSMTNNQAHYREGIADQIRHLAERLHGLEYRRESVWEHLERVADDPHAVVISNPPTYPGAYEQFFDTQGAITWDAPDYEVFDAPRDIPRMVEFMEGRKALLIVQQQQTRGNSAHPVPVYARQLSAGELVYINSNRPEEVEKVMDGLRVQNRRMPSHAARRYAVLPEDHDVTENSTIRVIPVDAGTAEAYREQWMHRISSAPGGANLLVLIDGYAACVMGYSMSSIYNSYSDKWPRHVILRFAFGAKHKSFRLTRLATLIALRKETMQLIASPKSVMLLAASVGLVTVEFTRHPEAKGLRGVMTLADRQSHVDGYKLVYAADWTEGTTLEQTLTAFTQGETRWLKNHAK